MRRRAFITLVGSATLGWPIAAAAQQRGRMRHIGVLLGGAPSDPGIAKGLYAFKVGLAELGWLDGQNIQIDYRYAAADVERMHALAKELIGQQSDLMILVGSGFVASLSQPGGNITGFINIEASLSGKWIEMIKEIVPRIASAALMFDPETAPYFAFYQGQFDDAARANGIEPVAAPVHSAEDIERAFENFGRSDVGLVLMPDVFLTTKVNLVLITSLAARHRLDNLSISIHGRGRWPDLLRHRQRRPLGARTAICRPHSQGSKAR